MEEYLSLIVKQNNLIIDLLSKIHDEVNWGEDLSLGNRVLEGLSRIESSLGSIESHVTSIRFDMPS
jgi:hypothetical protein